MKSVILFSGLVAALFSRNVKPEDDPWDDYVNDDIDVNDVDEEKAYEPNFNDSIFLENLPTAHYEQPIRWSTTKDIPYVVILGGSGNEGRVGKDTCNGVLLTKNVVMTLCSCVCSFLSFLHGLTPQKYVKLKQCQEEDLKPPIHVYVNVDFIDHLNVPVRHPTDDTPGERGEKPADKYTLINEPTEQVSNDKCVEIFKNSSQKFQKSWEQRTNFAFMRFSPDYATPTVEAFVPWPPIPILYDMTLFDKYGKESNLWAVHNARTPETVQIASLHYKPHHSVTKKFYDHFGREIDISDHMVVFRTTMCDQDFCVKHYPDIDRNEVAYQRRRIGCFCDDNKEDTICEGRYGAPVIHNGDLYGLLISPIKCNDASPRGVIAIAIDGPTIDYIATNVPGIAGRLLEEVNSTQFREKAIVSNYEVYIPQADLMPDPKEIPFTDKLSCAILPSVKLLEFLVPLCFFPLYQLSYQ